MASIIGQGLEVEQHACELYDQTACTLSRNPAAIAIPKSREPLPEASKAIVSQVSAQFS